MVETQRPVFRFLASGDLVDRYWYRRKMVTLPGVHRVEAVRWAPGVPPAVSVRAPNGERVTVERFDDDGAELIFHRVGEIAPALWPSPRLHR